MVAMASLDLSIFWTIRSGRLEVVCYLFKVAVQTSTVMEMNKCEFANKMRDLPNFPTQRPACR